MPQDNRYIVQARCSLTAWPEWRALRVETGRTLQRSCFEELLCRWGAMEEIVTDNGAAFMAALEVLADRYGIRHIQISALQLAGKWRRRNASTAQSANHS